MRAPRHGGVIRPQTEQDDHRHDGVTQVGGAAERAGVRELVLSHYLPAEPEAVTEAQWADRAGQGFSGTTTAGHDGLR